MSTASARVYGRGATCTRVRLLPANASGMVRASLASKRRASYVYGIVLPDVRDKHTNTKSEQEEYDWNEVREIDLTDLPVRCNHSERLAPVGRVYAFDPSPPHANALLELDEGVALEPSYARAALLGGTYSSLSLAHNYSTRVAAARGDSSRLALETRKEALEVSLCDEPGRPGSKVLEFLPSRNALRSANWHFLSTFAHNYKYPSPPEPADDAARNPVAARDASLNDYVDNTLDPLVQRRLDSLFEQRGFVRRSKDAMTKSALQTTNPQPDAQPATPPAAAAHAPMSTDTPQDAPPQEAASQEPPAAAEMATDEAPPKTTEGATSTTTQSELGDLEPREDDSPQTVIAKAFAREKQMLAKLAAYEKREAEERGKAEKAAAEEQRKKTDSFKTAAFAAAQQTVANLGLPEEKAKEAGTLLQQHAGQCIDRGMTLEEVNSSLGKFSEILVNASASAKKQKEEQEMAGLHSMTRQYAQQYAKQKTMNAQFSGGAFADPDADIDDKVEQSGKRRATSANSVPETGNYGFFGMSGVSPSGTVKASASSGAAPSQPAPKKKTGTPTVTTGDDGWQRKVFESLVRVDERTGHVEVPTYDEVARGGYEVVGVVKRNAAGEQVEVQEARPRFRAPQKIGPQHLYPELVKSLCAPFQQRRDDPDQDATMQMVAKGAQMPVGRDEGGSRRARSSYITKDGDETQYSTNFYWVRPDLRASGAL